MSRVFLTLQSNDSVEKENCNDEVKREMEPLFITNLTGKLAKEVALNKKQ